MNKTFLSNIYRMKSNLFRSKLDFTLECSEIFYTVYHKMDEIVQNNSRCIDTSRQLIKAGDCKVLLIVIRVISQR